MALVEEVICVDGLGREREFGESVIGAMVVTILEALVAWLSCRHCGKFSWELLREMVDEEQV